MTIWCCTYLRSNVKLYDGNKHHTAKTKRIDKIPENPNKYRKAQRITKIPKEFQSIPKNIHESWKEDHWRKKNSELPKKGAGYGT